MSSDVSSSSPPLGSISDGFRGGNSESDSSVDAANEGGVVGVRLSLKRSLSILFTVTERKCEK